MTTTIMLLLRKGKVVLIKGRGIMPSLGEGNHVLIDLEEIIFYLVKEKHAFMEWGGTILSLHCKEECSRVGVNPAFI